MANKRGGLLLDVRVGESICIHTAKGVDSEKIVVTLESKDGQRARVRVEASQSVRVVGKPARHTL